MATPVNGHREFIPGNYQYKALYEGKRLQRAWHDLRRILIRLVLNDIPYRRILDAGCGSGIIMDAIGRPGMDVACVDREPDCIRFAAQYLSALKPRLTVAEIDRTGLAPGSRDLVVCCEVLEHLRQEKVLPALRHFHDLLEPGGHLFLTVPNHCSTWVIIEWMLDRARLVPALKGEQHMCRFDCTSLARAVESAGFLLRRRGTFNFMSPFVGIVSRKAARFLLVLEARLLKRFGNLIYLLAQKGV